MTADPMLDPSHGLAPRFAWTWPWGRSKDTVDGVGVPRTDEELLVAVAGGDEEAFAVLHDRMAGLVFGNVRRLLCDPSVSGAVSQAIFGEVRSQAIRFDPARGPAQTWVLDLAHRRAVERLRSDQDGQADPSVGRRG